MAIIVSTSRSRMPWPAMASATPVRTRWRRPDSSRMQARSVCSSSTLGRMRRPTATTVSAARTSASGCFAATASAFSRARRIACWRGQLALGHALVDVGGNDRVRHDADAREQVEPARARRGEDQPHAR